MKTSRYSTSVVHFHEIVSCGSAKIFLGNDRTRELLSESEETSNQLAPLRKKYERMETCEQPSLTQQIDNELNKLSHIDLMISFNGLVRGDKLDPHPTLVREGMIHVNCPISEVEKAYEPMLQSSRLKGIFQKMDAALNANQTVFLHCNQGEHRSATILVLYLASRALCSFEFEEVHKFIRAKRDIKPYRDDHPTLMTTAYELYQKIWN